MDIPEGCLPVEAGPVPGPLAARPGPSLGGVPPEPVGKHGIPVEALLAVSPRPAHHFVASPEDGREVETLPASKVDQSLWRLVVLGAEGLAPRCRGRVRRRRDLPFFLFFFWGTGRVSSWCFCARARTRDGIFRGCSLDCPWIFRGSSADFPLSVPLPTLLVGSLNLSDNRQDLAHGVRSQVERGEAAKNGCVYCHPRLHSSGVRSFFDLLQAGQAVARLSSVEGPPRDRGMIWSACGDSHSTSQ